LIFVMLAVALTGMLLAHSGAVVPQVAHARPNLAMAYVPRIVVAWGMLVYVSRIGRPTWALAALLGRGWDSFRRASTDLLLALAGWGVILGVERAWVAFVGAHGAAAVVAMLPRTWTERAAWVVVAVSAGFCEEVVYRGYLQTQLTAFTRRPALAIALQAALFGLAHGEQGVGAMMRLTLYGLMLGALARLRRSLWPGIACHVWTDLVSGLVG
jgi:uncharacterized protein